ncbi:MAG: type II toxin-antitoxin system VapC family toxin [Acidobacteriaceae bacterium]
MIGLDTNILVRYITLDDPVQAARAAQIIERQLTLDKPGFASLVTMVELAWVLESFYEFSGEQIAAAIERMLQTPTLSVQNEREVFPAMMALRNNTASFSDALIGALGARAGCSSTLTFDRKAARLKEFQLA